MRAFSSEGREALTPVDSFNHLNAHNLIRKAKSLGANLQTAGNKPTAGF